MNEIRQNKGDDIKVVISGNKTDMSDKREISTDEGMRFAKENKASFIEVSAKSGENIAVMFQDIATALIGGETPAASAAAPAAPPQSAGGILFNLIFLSDVTSSCSYSERLRNKSSILLLINLLTICLTNE